MTVKAMIFMDLLTLKNTAIDGISPAISVPKLSKFLILHTFYLLFDEPEEETRKKIKETNSFVFVQTKKEKNSDDDNRHFFSSNCLDSSKKNWQMF